RGETVAVAMNGVDKPGMPGIIFDFLAKACDRMIDGSCTRRVRVAPNLTQQLVAVHHMFRAVCQITEQGELAMRQMNLMFLPPRHHRSKIDAHSAKGDAASARLHTPEHSSDSCHQFLEIERLSDIVIGTEVESLELVGALPFRRQHDDWRA